MKANSQRFGMIEKGSLRGNSWLCCSVKLQTKEKKVVVQSTKKSSEGGSYKNVNSCMWDHYVFTSWMVRWKKKCPLSYELQHSVFNHPFLLVCLFFVPVGALLTCRQRCYETCHDEKASYRSHNDHSHTVYITHYTKYTYYLVCNNRAKLRCRMSSLFWNLWHEVR